MAPTTDDEFYRDDQQQPHGTQRQTRALHLPSSTATPKPSRDIPQYGSDEEEDDETTSTHQGCGLKSLPRPALSDPKRARWKAWSAFAGAWMTTMIDNEVTDAIQLNLVDGKWPRFADSLLCRVEKVIGGGNTFWNIGRQIKKLWNMDRKDFASCSLFITAFKKQITVVGQVKQEPTPITCIVMLVDRLGPELSRVPLLEQEIKRRDPAGEGTQQVSQYMISTLYQPARDARWFMKIDKTLLLPDRPITNFTDSVNTQLLMTGKPKISTRWLDMRWFFVRDSIHLRKIELQRVDTATNTANGLTKALDRHKFDTFVKILEMENVRGVAEV
ncbi:hypothetical protein N7444_005850 [Penicillium canescens]|nr:hypothetical protein N7444_005850 [Penicillium canescens]